MALRLRSSYALTFSFSLLLMQIWLSRRRHRRLTTQPTCQLVGALQAKLNFGIGVLAFVVAEIVEFSLVA